MRSDRSCRTRAGAPLESLEPQQDGAGDPASLVCQAQGDAEEGRFDLGGPSAGGDSQGGGVGRDGGAGGAAPVELSWAEPLVAALGITGMLWCRLFGTFRFSEVLNPRSSWGQIHRLLAGRRRMRAGNLWMFSSQYINSACSS